MDHSIIHPQSSYPEKLTTGELIDTLRQTLKMKADRYFPVYTDMQETLQMVIMDMRGINPTCASFIQSTLNDYGKVSINSDQESPVEVLTKNIMDTKNSLVVLEITQEKVRFLLEKNTNPEKIIFLKSKQEAIGDLIKNTHAWLQNAETLHIELTTKQ